MYMDEPLCLLWGRLYNVLFFWFILLETTRIGELLEMTEQQLRRLLHLCFSTLLVFMNVAYGGMTDSIWIALSLLAVRLQLEKRPIAANIVAAFSIVVKPFFLMAWVIIVCSTERKIRIVLGKVALSLALTVPERLLLPIFFYRYREVMDASGLGAKFTQDLLRYSVKLEYMTVPLMLLIIGGLVIHAYMSEVKDLAKDFEIIGFRILLAYLAFLLLSTSNFYRPMMLVPWLFFLLVCRMETYAFSSLLGLILGTIGPMLLMVQRDPLFDLVAGWESVLLPPPNAIPHRFDWSFQALAWIGDTASNAYLVLSSIALLAVLLLLWIAMPDHALKRKLQWKSQPWMAADSPAGFWLTLARAALLPGWIIFSLVVYFLP